MDGLSQNGMMTSAFAEMFNDALHKEQEEKAVIVKIMLNMKEKLKKCLNKFYGEIFDEN